ncbi:MAG: hypothetical protein PQJ58_09915 [Spirochaetales bacterium]|nr:hypothetical protein [Spirochaetales bacterium]
MIFWGIRKKRLQGGALDEMQCPDCRKRELTKNAVIRYIHLYWIPLFTFSSSAELECAVCGKLIKGKELGSEMKKDIKSELITAGQILSKNFGVLLLLTVIFLFALYVSFS